MNDLRKAAEMALSALDGNCTNPAADPEQAAKEDAAIIALRTALDAEKPAEVEPVARVNRQGFIVEMDDIQMAEGTLLYTHPTTERRVPEWQPIETAPKDGNLILVTDGVDVVVGYWDFALRTVTSDLGDILTHWMPLPAAPAPTKEK